MHPVQTQVKTPASPGSWGTIETDVWTGGTTLIQHSDLKTSLAQQPSYFEKRVIVKCREGHQKKKNNGLEEESSNTIHHDIFVVNAGCFQTTSLATFDSASNQLFKTA